MSDVNTVKVKIQGTAPLMMHNVRLANPLDPFTKALKEYTSKRKKEEADHIEMSHREFLGGLYCNPDLGPYVPADALSALLIAGAKHNKLGSKFEGCVFVDKDAPLNFDGPRDPEKLWETGVFNDIRPVQIGQSKVQRCRPIFKDWNLKFEIVLVGGNGVEIQDIQTALDVAGRFKGLLEYRPRYGRFEVEKFEVTT